MSVNWRSRIIGHGEEAPDQLLANPANWRIHPKAQQDALAGVLGEIGWVQSVIVNKRTGHLVDGHLRVSLALRDEASSIPVVYVDLSPDEEALALATLDPLAAMAATDGAKLAELLSGVSFDNAALEGILGDLAIDAAKALGKLDAAETDVPEAPAEPKSKLGDVWLLGRHRLVVGDSTKAETWQKLMAGKRFDLLWTDPPYGIEYEGKTKNKLTIQNDGLATLEDLLNGVFGLANDYGIEGAAVYVAHPDGPNSVYFQNAFLAQGWRWHQRLIWVKDTMVMGHSDYHQQHEAILFGYLPGGGRRGRGGAGWYGPNNEVSAIHHDRPKANKEHPTMKPIGLVAKFVQNSAPIDGIVVDPFCGSGTTILAAEQTKRIGYGVELEPKYADVICARFEKMTGITPVLELSGKAVSFV
jgi:DNA modification methylase